MWLGVLVAICGALIFGFHVMAKRAFTKHRVVSSLEELRTAVRKQVSFDIFREVWTVVGKAYESVWY